MRLQNSVLRESHCHGAKAISGKVVPSSALKAIGITYTLGSMIVVKKGSQ